MTITELSFDFDGTLIDSCPAILDSLRHALDARGVTPVRPLTRDLIGPPLRLTLEVLIGSSDQMLIDALAGEFRARYDTEGIFSTVAYPGVAEILRAHLNAGKRLHLATNKRQRPTLLLLNHFGWRPLFASIYCVDSGALPFTSKGEMLKAQVREQGIDVSSCIYVGDTRHDEQAAEQAGIPFVAAGWGYGSGTQAVSASARVLASPQELLQLM